MKTILPPACALYGYQLLVLIALAVVSSWLSRRKTLDKWITWLFVRRATHHRFPPQKNPLLDLLNHRLAKYIPPFAMAVGALFYGA